MTDINTISSIIVFVIFILVWIAGKKKQPGSDKDHHKKISETKCTCAACGHIWYYGKQEEIQNRSDRMTNSSKTMSNCGSDMMCCGGCWPAVFIPKEQIKDVKDLNKCAKCNSAAIKKEQITHEVNS
jgi:hypothetical protein